MKWKIKPETTATTQNPLLKLNELHNKVLQNCMNTGRQSLASGEAIMKSVLVIELSVRFQRSHRTFSLSGRRGLLSRHIRYLRNYRCPGCAMPAILELTPRCASNFVYPPRSVPGRFVQIFVLIVLFFLFPFVFRSIFFCHLIARTRAHTHTCLCVDHRARWRWLPNGWRWAQEATWSKCNQRCTGWCVAHS